MIIIDVRTAFEFSQGHLTDAIQIDYQVIEQKIEALVPDKSAKIGLYCAAGVRSGIAHYLLQNMGYDNTLNLGGYESLKSDYPYTEP